MLGALQRQVNWMSWLSSCWICVLPARRARLLCLPLCVANTSQVALIWYFIKCKDGNFQCGTFHRYQAKSEVLKAPENAADWHAIFVSQRLLMWDWIHHCISFPVALKKRPWLFWFWSELLFDYIRRVPTWGTVGWKWFGNQFSFFFTIQTDNLLQCLALLH